MAFEDATAPQPLDARAGDTAEPAATTPAPVRRLSPIRHKPRYDVFISYSHDDREEAVFLERDLKALGLQVWRDNRLQAAPAASSIDSINEAFLNSARVVVLWSDRSVKSHWVREEAEAARNTLKIVSLALAPVDSLNLPGEFRNLPIVAISEIRQDPGLLLRNLGAVEDANQPGSFTLARHHLKLDRLPQTFAVRLFGRDEELRFLTESWDKGFDTNVIAFDALSGTGKTALIVHFVRSLQISGWRGAQAVFAWSFHPQGSNRERQGESASFFDSAFAFFAKGPSPEWKARQALASTQGSGDLAWPPEKDGDKGAELARHIQAQRTLLVLDGLDPLQHAAESSTETPGRLKDPALKALLEALIPFNPGLCLVTTRHLLHEFQGCPGFCSVALQKLDTVSSMSLLRGLGVEGQFPSGDYHAWRQAFGETEGSASGRIFDPVPEGVWHLPPYDTFAERLPSEIQGCRLPIDYVFPKDLEPGLDRIDRTQGEFVPINLGFKLLDIVTRFEGHALSLTLLGNYLRTFQHGSLEATRETPLLDIYPGEVRAPFSILRAIESALARQVADPTHDRQLHPGETEPGKQLAILLFLGMFDQPAPMSLLPVVFAGQPPVLDSVQDPPIDVSPLEAIYRKHNEAEEVWKALALHVETERRSLFRNLFLWTPGYSPSEFTRTLAQLAAQGLVHMDTNRPWDLTEIDCHPLVREYFGQRLRELDPAMFEAAQARL